MTTIVLPGYEPVVENAIYAKEVSRVDGFELTEPAVRIAQISRFYMPSLPQLVDRVREISLECLADQMASVPECLKAFRAAPLSAVEAIAYDQGRAATIFARKFVELTFPLRMGEKYLEFESNVLRKSEFEEVREMALEGEDSTIKFYSSVLDACEGGAITFSMKLSQDLRLPSKRKIDRILRERVRSSDEFGISPKTIEEATYSAVAANVRTVWGALSDSGRVFLLNDKSKEWLESISVAFMNYFGKIFSPEKNNSDGNSSAF